MAGDQMGDRAEAKNQFGECERLNAGGIPSSQNLELETLRLQVDQLTL